MNLEEIMRNSSMVLKRNSQKLKAQPSGIPGNETYEMSNFNMAIILCYVGNFLFYSISQILFWNYCLPHDEEKAEHGSNWKFQGLFLNLDCNKWEYLKDHSHFSDVLVNFQYGNLKISISKILYVCILWINLRSYMSGK